MTCVTSWRATTISTHGLQTLSGSPEVNGGWEWNSGPEWNGGPERKDSLEGNHGLEENDEYGRIEARHFWSYNPKCSASIRPYPYFVDRWPFFFQCN